MIGEKWKNKSAVVTKSGEVDWKKEAQKQWNKTPCGEISGNKKNIDYFLSVEHHRYEEYARWIKPFFQFSKYGGKKILEIGYGQGTDLCQFALAGAECFGVDITEEHFILAKRNLKLRGLQANLFLADASKLPFANESFDVVYSFGVLHHTPDINQCISESYRVLQPGGKFLVTLYHKNSAFYLFSVLLVKGLFKGMLRKLGYKGLLSTIEKGADGVHIKPLVKLYTPSEVRNMLIDFRNVSLSVKHLERSHFSFLGRFIPSFILPLLEKKIGWYIIAEAVK